MQSRPPYAFFTIQYTYLQLRYNFIFASRYGSISVGLPHKMLSTQFYKLNFCPHNYYVVYVSAQSKINIKTKTVYFLPCLDRKREI